MNALLFAFALGCPDAAALELERFPLEATVDLSTCTDCGPGARGEGAVAIPIPALLRSAADPADGSDLALVDAAGTVVPTARARGRGQTQRFPLEVDLGLPLDTYVINKVDRPFDGLTLDPGPGPTAATVQVWEHTPQGLKPHGEPQLIWTHAVGDHTEVDFPSTRGPLMVQLDWHTRRPWQTPSIRGRRRAQPDAPPATIHLPVVNSRIEEDGTARYTIDLPRPLQLESMTLSVRDPLFERRVQVITPEEDTPFRTFHPTGTIQRVRIGSAAVDRTRVDLSSVQPTDQLILLVDTDGRTPLTIDTVTVEMEGMVLLVHDPGPGPFRLMAGAPRGTAPRSDLQTALPEVARLVQGEVVPTDIRVHDAYVPPELRGELAAPSTPIPVRRFDWAQAVQGATGLVRIPLTAETLAGARPDLGDLRLIDADDRQIPYLLRRRAVDHSWGELAWRREEQGKRSLIRVRLPAAEVTTSTVTLRTAAPMFSRAVTLSRSTDGALAPIRTFQWQGQDRPMEATLTVETKLGDELVVLIDNGDNPPLPLDGVSAAWPQWELLAWVPEGGATLLYGDPRLASPDYDLQLLTAELIRRPAPVAALGPQEARQPPPPPLADRVVLLGGIGLLVVGLGALTVRLVRAVPASNAGARRATTDG